jgi:hypothetical protein
MLGLYPPDFKGEDYSTLLQHCQRIFYLLRSWQTASVRIEYRLRVTGYNSEIISGSLRAVWLSETSKEGARYWKLVRILQEDLNINQRLSERHFEDVWRGVSRLASYRIRIGEQ